MYLINYAHRASYWLQFIVSQIYARFGENIASDPGHVNIFPASCIPKRIHHLLKPIYRLASGDAVAKNKMKEKGFQITTEPRILSSVLQWTPDEQVVLFFLHQMLLLFFSVLEVGGRGEGSCIVFKCLKYLCYISVLTVDCVS